MKQMLQRLDDGETLLEDVPVPRASGPTIVVRTQASVISPGTERMLVEFGRASLLEKARSQPDRVRDVLNKVRTDGLAPTVEAVRSKLSVPVPLGYCQAGTVVESGGHSPFRVGDRVATNGPHAEYVRVPYTLAARIPDGVPFEHAAFAPLAAIGLQGIRLAAPTLGETVIVSGLGLIGLLAVQLLRTCGCRVIGIDPNPERLGAAERFGALAVAAGNEAVRRVLDATGGVGADAVLLTLASASDEPMAQAAAMSRKRGRIVLVGVTGLRLQRDWFYKKELSFQVSCSYGPGRYDPAYEEHAHDYPLPYVRWTEQRNFEAVLGLMGEGRLQIEPLISDRLPFGEAPSAYDRILSGRTLGVVLQYPDAGVDRPLPGAIRRTAPAAPAAFSVGVIGAGAFASRVLLPALRGAGATLRILASSGGVTAATVGRRFGFEVIATEVDRVLADPSVDTVLVLTRHDSHAHYARAALELGKHVFVEKPLALTLDDLETVAAAAQGSAGSLTVGFNRRFAPLAVTLRDEVAARSGPLALVITVNAGHIPADHWTQDPAVGGGRIVGEACHFLDLSRFLVGHSISDATVRTAFTRDGRVIEDVAAITVAFEDGSLATIHYLANGPRSFPKERIECFFDGRVGLIDNWRRLLRVGYGGRWARKRKMDKGHAAEMVTLGATVRSGGPPPIPLHELLEVSRWAIHLGDSARRGGPTAE